MLELQFCMKVESTNARQVILVYLQIINKPKGRKCERIEKMTYEGPSSEASEVQ